MSDRGGGVHEATATDEAMKPSFPNGYTWN